MRLLVFYSDNSSIGPICMDKLIKVALRCRTSIVESGASHRSLLRACLLSLATFYLSPTNTFAVIVTPAADVRAVAVSGETLPGLGPDVQADKFSYPFLSRAGNVAFSAELLNGPGGVNFDNDSGIWSEQSPNNIDFVLREGDQALWMDYNFAHVAGDLMSMSANGDVYVVNALLSQSSPTIRSSGIFQRTPDGQLLVRALSSPIGGSSVPWTTAPSGTHFLSSMDSNESGDITFVSGSNTLWTINDSEGLTQLTFGTAPRINSAGDVAYRVGGGRVDFHLEVREKDSGDLRTVTEVGLPAPGISGGTFNTFVNMDHTDTGVIFLGRVTGSGITAVNDFGIWSETSPGGPLELLLREGAAAPGTEAGVTWTGFDLGSQRTLFGRSGGLAVRLQLQGPGVAADNDSGVWVGTNKSDLHLLAREGDQAPGVEVGIVFTEFTQAGVMGDGRGVFFARLSGDGLEAGRDHGIWAQDADGTLQLIVRSGDWVPLPSGDLAQLKSVQLNPDASVSELGHIGFIGNLLDDRRGIFVSSAVAVPEPATLLILAVAGCVVLLRRGEQRSWC